MIIRSKKNLSFVLIPRNAHEFLYAILLFSLVFLPWIPEPTSIASFLFAMSYIGCMGLWFLGLLKNRFILDKVQFYILLLIITLLGVNFIVRKLTGIEIQDWFRSAAPLFLLSFGLFVFRMVKFSSFDYVISMFIIMGIAWCCMQIYQLDNTIFYIIKNNLRTTYQNQNFILPYPLLLFLLILFFYSKNILSFFFLLMTLAMLILASGYKAHIVLSCFSVFVYLILYAKKTVIVILSLTLCLLFFSVSGYLFDYAIYRLSLIGGNADEIRIAEINSALSAFYAHPIVGNGIGYSFYIGNSVFDVVNPMRTYIHNSVLYFLSTTGLFGVLIYSSFILYCLLYKNSDLRFKIILFVMLITTLTAASYKLVHFNIFLAILVAGCLMPISNEKKKTMTSESI